MSDAEKAGASPPNVPPPVVVLLGGPNGSGKTTSALLLLKGLLDLTGVREPVERVAARVRLGGHSVPESTIRQRYAKGLRNFFTLYEPLAHVWRVYDNSGATPRLIARGGRQQVDEVFDRTTWRRMTEAVR
ncbi:MAG: hypothetical protein AB1716_11455 [Planctomycetota bacterium]